MLRTFCCTNTRVTLDTPMPPRIRIDEADQAQVVLGARQVLADAVLRSASSRATRTNSFANAVGRASAPSSRTVASGARSSSW